MKPAAASLIMASLFASPAVSSAPLDCLIQPNQVIEVGSPVPGVIHEILVDRGDEVKMDQRLARLQDDVERAALRLADARARTSAEVVAAEKSQEFAARELKRANDLAGDSFVSRNYVDKASTEASIAESKLAQAMERRRLAEIELEVARAQLEQRRIDSPINGVVLDRMLNVGEYVDTGAILRVAQIDPLRVEVVVPSELFGRVKTGQIGIISPQFADAEPVRAEVSAVDRVVDAASATFRVRLSLPNPGMRIPPGVRCQVHLDLRPDSVREQTQGYAKARG
ncbi:MAG: efflux RND transporter periplasmic adaptor subunit [Burkholderiaceae bacterium]